MKFYRVAKVDSTGESVGFAFATTLREAQQLARESARDNELAAPVAVEEISVEPSKAGILKALRRYASHPDNG